MNKGGFLLANQVVKIVIAIICIVFLVYLLSSLYFAKVNAEKLKKAKDFLEGENGVNSIVSNIKEEGIVTMNRAPSGWYLFSFTGQIKPNNCLGKNCVCVCDNKYFGDYFDRQTSECNDNGACLIIENLKSYSPELEFVIDINKGLSIKKLNNQIELSVK